MGGKFWSKEEERVFWLDLVPHSPKRLGDDIENNEEQTWDWVGEQMYARFGEDRRREYTHLCVFEHYFQNTCLGRRSPNIGNLADKYRAHEEAMKKYREEMAALQAKEKAEKEAEKEAEKDVEEESESTEEEDSGDESIKQESSEDESGDSDSEASIKAESVKGKGTQDAPIELDCQYTTIPHYHDHTPVPRFTVLPAPPSFAPPGPAPRPQHYFHQFLANHDRFENAGLEEDGLFVTQSSAPWVDPVALRPYGYYHRTAPGHGPSSSTQFSW